MLEKFSKKLEKFYNNFESKKASDEALIASPDFLFDAHFHYAVCQEKGICDLPENWQGISCAHSKEEFDIQSKALPCVIQAYGMHPQTAAFIKINENTDFLEKLLRENKIELIGEAGFDYFTEDFRSSTAEQEEIWNIQLELALKYKVPLVVHCRKANHKLFEYSKKLSLLPEVLFHSFMGPPAEALSLCRHGINAYFSFGKQLLNNNKKAIACVKELPVERILPETDAPFQTLKGELYTKPSEIIKVINEIKKLRSLSPRT